MKNVVHIYVTDKCTTHCPFCVMASGPMNNNFMDVDKVVGTVEQSLCQGMENIVRLIGGEPLAHPDFEKVVKTLLKEPLVLKMEVITNGIGLEREILFLKDFAEKCKKIINIRLSINYWLLKTNGLYSSEEFLSSFVKEHASRYLVFTFNIGIRKGEDWIKEKYSNLASSMKCWARSVHLTEYVPGSNKQCENGLYLRRNLICPHFCEKEEFVMPDGSVLRDAEEAAEWMWSRSKYYENPGE